MIIKIVFTDSKKNDGSKEDEIEDLLLGLDEVDFFQSSPEHIKPDLPVLMDKIVSLQKKSERIERESKNLEQQIEEQGFLKYLEEAVTYYMNEILKKGEENVVYVNELETKVSMLLERPPEFNYKEFKESEDIDFHRYEINRLKKYIEYQKLYNEYLNRILSEEYQKYIVDRLTIFIESYKNRGLFDIPIYSEKWSRVKPKDIRKKGILSYIGALR